MQCIVSETCTGRTLGWQMQQVLDSLAHPHDISPMFQRCSEIWAEVARHLGAEPLVDHVKRSRALVQAGKVVRLSQQLKASVAYIASPAYKKCYFTYTIERVVLAIRINRGLNGHGNLIAHLIIATGIDRDIDWF